MIAPLAPSAKAEQLERSFGIRHANKALNGALRKPADLSEVTPYERESSTDALLNLMRSRELQLEDAAIVMLMRGARLEAIAAAMYRPPNKPGMLDNARRVASVGIRKRVSALTDAHRERLIEVSHETIRLWAHV